MEIHVALKALRLRIDLKHARLLFDFLCDDSDRLAPENQENGDKAFQDAAIKLYRETTSKSFSTNTQGLDKTPRNSDREYLCVTLEMLKAWQGYMFPRGRDRLIALEPTAMADDPHMDSMGQIIKQVQCRQIEDTSLLEDTFVGELQEQIETMTAYLEVGAKGKSSKDDDELVIDSA